MPRVGFLHTAGPHVRTFAALVEEADASATCVHRVEPDLLDRARRDGSTDVVETATLEALERLADDGVDVLVCTCSTLGPVAEAVGGRLAVPVLRVDRPMAHAAVRAGERIAVVAALQSTLGPTRALLLDEARRAGRAAPSITDVVVADAWAAFEAEDTRGYVNRL
ncbi:MAG: aspartate/glutamate racemase family protein [Nocardioidaceae bacterium]